MSERRRALAFLCHPYHRGGVTRWMVDAAAEWVRRGRPCWFVVPTPRRPFVNGAGRPPQVHLIDALPARQKPTLVMPLVGEEFEFGTGGYRARVYARAVQEGVPVGVPIIVSDDPDTWRAAAMLVDRNPLIGVLHADDTPYYALAARYHRAASAIVAVSKRILDRSRSALHGSQIATAVIPCGIPLPSAEMEMGNEPPPLRLVWVGRISESQKRVSDLAKIAGLLRDAGTSFQLDIIGDGDAAATLRMDMQNARVLERVHFHGWLSPSAVLTVLRRSDVMLLPSNFEGMPVAAMEALASGCAVVGSSTCGLEEYADLPESIGALWIYPRGNVHDAVQSIHAALETPRHRRRSAARQLAEMEFSIERCLERYQQLLHQMPERGLSDASIGTWHPADAVSRSIAFARRCRVAISRRVARWRVSTHRVRPAAA